MQRLQRETTNSEWLNWLRFMRQEPNLFHRGDHYTAKLIATMKARKGQSTTAADELIVFTYDDDKPKRKQTRAEYTSRSKQLWCGLVGLVLREDDTDAGGS